MKIFSLEEHAQCKDYIANKKIGFRHLHLKANDSLELNNIPGDKILFILSGSVELHSPIASDQVINVGNMLAFSNKELIEGYATKTSQILILIINPMVIKQSKIMQEFLINRTKEKNNQVLRTLPIRKPLDLMLEMTYNELESGIYCFRLNASKQKEFLNLLSTLYPKHEIASFLYTLLSTMNDFEKKILENLDNAISVEQLAKLLGMDIKEFTRIFRKTFDEKPSTWLHKRRNANIELYLKDETLLLKDIAEKMGFSSNTHFSTYCKKHLGKTPKEYRKELLGK